MRFPCLSADGEAIGTAQDDEDNMQNVRVVRMKLLKLHFYAFLFGRRCQRGRELRIKKRSIGKCPVNLNAVGE